MLTRRSISILLLASLFTLTSPLVSSAQDFLQWFDPDNFQTRFIMADGASDNGAHFRSAIDDSGKIAVQWVEEGVVSKLRFQVYSQDGRPQFTDNDGQFQPVDILSGNDVQLLISFDPIPLPDGSWIVNAPSDEYDVPRHLMLQRISEDGSLLSDGDRQLYWSQNWHGIRRFGFAPIGNGDEVLGICAIYKVSQIIGWEDDWGPIYAYHTYASVINLDGSFEWGVQGILLNDHPSPDFIYSKPDGSVVYGSYDYASDSYDCIAYDGTLVWSTNEAAAYENMPDHYMENNYQDGEGGFYLFSVEADSIQHVLPDGSFEFENGFLPLDPELWPISESKIIVLPDQSIVLSGIDQILGQLLAQRLIYDGDSYIPQWNNNNFGGSLLHESFYGNFASWELLPFEDSSCVIVAPTLIDENGITQGEMLIQQVHADGSLRWDSGENEEGLLALDNDLERTDLHILPYKDDISSNISFILGELNGVAHSIRSLRLEDEADSLTSWLEEDIRNSPLGWEPTAIIQMDDILVVANHIDSRSLFYLFDCLTGHPAENFGTVGIDLFPEFTEDDQSFTTIKLMHSSDDFIAIAKTSDPRTYTAKKFSLHDGYITTEFEVELATTLIEPNGGNNSIISCPDGGFYFVFDTGGVRRLQYLTQDGDFLYAGNEIPIIGELVYTQNIIPFNNSNFLTIMDDHSDPAYLELFDETGTRIWEAPVSLTRNAELYQRSTNLASVLVDNGAIVTFQDSTGLRALFISDEGELIWGDDGLLLLDYGINPEGISLSSAGSSASSFWLTSKDASRGEDLVNFWHFSTDGELISNDSGSQMQLALEHDNVITYCGNDGSIYAFNKYRISHFNTVGTLQPDYPDWGFPFNFSYQPIIIPYKEDGDTKGIIAVSSFGGPLFGQLFYDPNTLGSDLSNTELPDDFELYAAYPNPFNPSVTIPFALPETAKTRISIHNILGQEVARILETQVEAGNHQVLWNGKSDNETSAASGVYFVRMEASSFSETRKIFLLK